MNIPDRRSDLGCKGMEKYWNKQTFFSVKMRVKSDEMNKIYENINKKIHKY